MSDQAKPIGRVEAPLVNPNEPESQVVELSIEPYSPISRGDVVCTVETSKATFVVESEHDGFVGEIEVSLGEHVTAGQLICQIFDRLPDRVARGDPAAVERPAGVKLTRKAERLALEHGIDLSTLPTNRFLTERDIEALLPGPSVAVEIDESISALVHDRAAVVFGGGGFAKSLIDLMRSAQGIDPICVVDDDPGRTGDVLGLPVIGGRDYLAPLRAAGLRYAVNAVGAIGRIQDRIAIFELLDELGLELPTLVDPAAFVAESATLAEGAQVFAGRPRLLGRHGREGDDRELGSDRLARLQGRKLLAPGPGGRSRRRGRGRRRRARRHGRDCEGRPPYRVGCGRRQQLRAARGRATRHDPLRGLGLAAFLGSSGRRQRRVRSTDAAVNSTG